MRLLLALDGSPGSELARDLVAAHPWPAGTSIDAVRVVEPIIDALAGPGYVIDIPATEVLDLESMRAALATDVEPLRAAGLAVEPVVLVGRPASIIVERARRQRADLIVIGSRGRGPIVSMLLGSVSAEVAGHAPCPVLVARTATIGRAIVALDGTPGADRVLDAAIASPLLAGRQVTVVSVAPSRVPTAGVMFSGGYGVPIGWYEESVMSFREELERAARNAVARFAAVGIDATYSIAEGDPAATLIEVARRGAADLIVVGTHGRTGLARLVLGSVARNVLLHTHASVLVLHGAEDPVESEGATREEPAASGAR